MVDKTKCIGCGLCVANCPVGAISMKGGVAVIDYNICIRCGLCENLCPVNAIKIKTN